MAWHRQVPAQFHHLIIGGKHACPWCGLLCEGKRRIWHPECVTEHNLANHSSSQRSLCWSRDQGVCAKCGFDCKTVIRCVRGRTAAMMGIPVRYITEVSFEPSRWDADHIFPLWLVDRTNADWRKYFGAENLQTLCDKCHKAKSAREAAQRAKINRLKTPKPKMKRLKFAPWKPTPTKQLS